MRRLMKRIVKGAEPTRVPNLTWRDSAGEIWENPFTHVPDDLSTVMLGYYDYMLRSVVRYRDLNSSLPFRHWLRYPITAVLTCRGCTHNCIICGGSCAAFRQCYCRERPAFRKPEAVARDVKNISRFSNGPIFVLGDLTQAGEEYAYKLLKLLKRNRVKNRLILELFGPAPRELIKKMGESCPGFCLEISPESHDPEIRNACGRNYSTEDLENTIGYALEAGCSRMDIFFMFGLPKQTPQSVMETVDYCRHLFQKFDDRRVFPFTAPLSPFLDPGSLAFESPERYGYRLLFHTLEAHRQALLAPSWKYHLNYETQWMSRAELVESTYNAELALNRLKANYGIITRQQASETIHRLYTAIELIQQIDRILDSGGEQGKQLAKIRETVDLVNMSRAGGKQELELPMGGVKIKPLGALRSILSGR
jgi:B12-binding domain/radical SAM domain protein